MARLRSTPPRWYNVPALGDVTLGAYKLKTTNLVFKEIDTSSMAVRNAADDAYRNIIGNIVQAQAQLKWASQVTDVGGNGVFESKNANDNYVTFHARDNGVGLVEAARLVGAADPFMCITGILATLPGTGNLPSGFWTIGYVAGGTAALYVNHGGTSIKSVGLGTPA